MTEPQQTFAGSNDEGENVSGVETGLAATQGELDLKRVPLPSDTTTELPQEDDFKAIPLQSGETESGSRILRRFNVTADAAPHDKSFRPGQSVILLYSRPRQRQRWGDTQILPRVNWGDLFFDLFYVGTTYNISDIVVGAPDPTGLLYAAGTFLPVMGIWSQKMFYDARYVTESDFYHRCLNIMRLLILGVAFVHIQPVEQLSNDFEYPAMFTFSLMLVLECILCILLALELRLTGVGQPALKAASMRDVRGQCVSLVFYMAAMILSAVHYFSHDDNIIVSQRGRGVAESSPKTDVEINHVPIVLVLSGYLISLAALTIKVVFCFPSGGRHKEM
jgi:hypothetical protein